MGNFDLSYATIVLTFPFTLYACIFIVYICILTFNLFLYFRIYKFKSVVLQYLLNGLSNELSDMASLLSQTLLQIQEVD